MPRIKTFTAPSARGGQIGGRAAGAGDFGAGIGAGLQNVGGQLGQLGEDIQQFRETEDLRSLQLGMAKLHEKYGRALEEAETSGADVEQITEQFQNDISDLESSAETAAGRQWAGVSKFQATEAFGSEARKLITRRAAQQAKLQAEEFGNTLGTTVARDPTQLGLVETQVSEYVDTFTRLSPEQRAALKADMTNQMNVAAVNSWVNLNPEFALEELENGAFNLTPAQRAAGIGTARTRIRQLAADERARRLEAEWHRKQRAEAAAQEMVEMIFDSNPETRGEVVRTVLNHPDLTAAQREHYIELYEAQAKVKGGAGVADKPGAVAAARILERIRAPRTITNEEGEEVPNPDRIMDIRQIERAFIDLQITQTQLDFLRDEFRDITDPAGQTFRQALDTHLDAIKATVDQSTLAGKDPEGANQFMLYSMALREEIAKVRKEGGDPWALITPGQSNYFAARTPLSRPRSFREVTRSRIEALRGDRGRELATGKADVALPTVTRQGPAPVPAAEGGEEGEEGTAPLQEIPKVKSVADFQELEPGTRYEDPDGNIRVKQ